MQISLEDVKILCGNRMHLTGLVHGVLQVKPCRPFDVAMIAFLDRVSGALLHDKAVSRYPDIVTFAFFCRKANLNKLVKEYAADDMKLRLGRGLIFHIAPGNVPINFAYTLVMGLLSGNACVVKAPSRDFKQTGIISEAFSRVLQEDEFGRFTDYVHIIQYPGECQNITEAFSAVCNVRVIWGGDLTINSVRAAGLQPRAFDITFADRYSLAVFSAAAIIEAARDEVKMHKLAQDFYNDTYLYDQNACSSPRLICWLGTSAQARKAQDIFWRAVYDNIQNRYPVEAVVAVDKMLAVCRTGIAEPQARLENGYDNRIVRIQISKLDKRLPDWRCAGGLFHEYITDSLLDLAGIVDEKYQTLSYYGVEPELLQTIIMEQGLRGIDRIVPVGKTAEMGLIWDGMDMIRTMSRLVALV